MPLVNVKLIEGDLTPEQKREMIQRVTDTMVEIEGENLRQVTWVVVEESGVATGVSAAAVSPPLDMHPLQGRSAATVGA